MSVTGASQFLSAPLVAMSKKFISFPIMLTYGMLVFGLGCYMNSNLTNESRFWEFLLPQILRGSSLMFCFIPLAEIVFSTLPKSDMQDASGLYNLMRTLGGAIGLAVINTTIVSEVRIISAGMIENISHRNSYIMSMIEASGNILSSKIANGELASLKIIQFILQKEAMVITINNIFMYISIIFLLGIVLIPLIKEIKHDKIKK